MSHFVKHSQETKLKISNKVKLIMAERKAAKIPYGRPRIDQKSGIYKITSPNGSVYIGQSVRLHSRFRDFTYKIPNKKVQLSIDTYGWENHEKQILHELPKDVSRSVLDTYEKLYMECFKNCGFNLLNIKEGGKNGKMGEETRMAQIGRKHKPESILKIIAAKIGHNNTPKRKIICAQSGIIYNGAKDAANAIGMKENTLRNQLCGFNINKTTLKYL